MHKTAPAYSPRSRILVADQLTKWLMIGPLDLERVAADRPAADLQPHLGAEFRHQPWPCPGAERHAALAAGRDDRGDRGRRWPGGSGARSRRGDRLALGLVLGGALGNIVDRVRFGYVVDFLDLHFGEFRPFYVFNVADAAISIGVVILLLRAFLVRDKVSKDEASEGTNEHA